MTNNKPKYDCQLISVLVSRHCWGSPISRDAAVNFAAVPSHDLDRAKDDFETLRTSEAYPFVGNRGPEQADLKTDEFGALAQFLYDTCDWERWKIESKLEHFETDEFAFD